MRIVISNKLDFQELYRFVKNKSLGNKDIIVDLSPLKEIKPSGVLAIVMFVIFYKNSNSKITIIQPQDYKLKKYLNDINLFQFCQKNWEQSSYITPITSRTAFPIWRLDTEHLTDYILRVSKYHESICPEKDLVMYQQCIAELINNVYDHSKSDFGAYIFTQFFPGKREIETTVADLGVGIPFNINKYFRDNGRNPISDQKCLITALSENFSTHSFPHNKGKGLNTVYSFIEKNKGILRIYSGSAHYELSNGEVSIDDNPINHFKGTIVNIIIKVDNLQNIENEEIIDELW